MKIIGLTGLMAVGKSYVKNILEKKGIEVFDCDVEVKNLYKKKAIINVISKKFPQVVQDNVVDTKKLGDIVFADNNSLKIIESIIHPIINEKIEKFIKLRKKKKDKYVVLEIPLLYEKNYDQLCDIIIVITSPISIQRKIGLERLGMSKEKFDQIIKIQSEVNDKLSRADYVIYNYSTISLDEQIKIILKKEGLF